MSRECHSYSEVLSREGACARGPQASRSGYYGTNISFHARNAPCKIFHTSRFWRLWKARGRTYFATVYNQVSERISRSKKRLCHGDSEALVRL